MRLLALALVAFMVAGCTMPVHEVTTNRYAGIAPNLANKSYAGLWTGANSSSSISLRIDEDGRGVSCSSLDGRDLVNSLKVADETLYFQDGTSMALTYAEGYIYGTPSDAPSHNVRFAQDNGLVGASPSCREQLQKPYL